MDVNRAYTLGVRSTDCTIRAALGHRCGRWVIRWNDLVVTESADIFAMLRFVTTLKRMEDRNVG